MSLLKSAALAPHIHLAVCHDDLVVLDVLADDYALLPDAAPLVRLGPEPGWVEAEASVIAELAGLGLFAPDAAPPRRPLPRLSGEILPASGARPSAALMQAAFNSLLSTAVFARSPFPALVAKAAARRSAATAPSDRRIARATAAFQTIHPWIPFEGDCLQRGYRLHHHLHGCGLDARWVFGVRTWPFLAHCWVQVGDRVVGDTSERVATFSPILAV